MRWLLPFLSLWMTVPAAAEPLRDGDLVFHTSLSAQSAAIQRATRSPYSHVGMVLYRGKQAYVFEAIATVRYTPVADWIKRGKGGAYVLKRLARADEQWTPAALGKLKQVAKQFEGKPYDLAFGWSDERIYCSELVWKMYQQALGVELGQQQRLRDFQLDDPVVKAKLRERYGAKPPLDEPVVSPAAVFDSPLLVTVVPDKSK
jgi:cell wall-associated NlpC family hydrolase